ncbi:neuronal-specific septin-3 isoform X2 [Paramormyrops kingsleyae]|uniref:neuronal-specific septin-3 isoform X2 n=1 Tax=Paramormyrops kingsleyae TaxID=1676925 RepID=UPI003B96F669
MNSDNLEHTGIPSSQVPALSSPPGTPPCLPQLPPLSSPVIKKRPIQITSFDSKGLPLQTSNKPPTVITSKKSAPSISIASESLSFIFHPSISKPSTKLSKPTWGMTRSRQTNKSPDLPGLASTLDRDVGRKKVNAPVTCKPKTNSATVISQKRLPSADRSQESILSLLPFHMNQGPTSLTHSERGRGGQRSRQLYKSPGQRTAKNQTAMANFTKPWPKESMQSSNSNQNKIIPKYLYPNQKYTREINALQNRPQDSGLYQAELVLKKSASKSSFSISPTQRECSKEPDPGRNSGLKNKDQHSFLRFQGLRTSASKGHDLSLAYSPFNEHKIALECPVTREIPKYAPQQKNIPNRPLPPPPHNFKVYLNPPVPESLQGNHGKQGCVLTGHDYQHRHINNADNSGNLKPLNQRAKGDTPTRTDNTEFCIERQQYGEACRTPCLPPSKLGSLPTSSKMLLLSRKKPESFKNQLCQFSSQSNNPKRGFLSPGIVKEDESENTVYRTSNINVRNYSENRLKQAYPIDMCPTRSTVVYQHDLCDVLHTVAASEASWRETCTELNPRPSKCLTDLSKDSNLHLRSIHAGIKNSIQVSKSRAGPQDSGGGKSSEIDMLPPNKLPNPSNNEETDLCSCLENEPINIAKLGLLPGVGQESLVIPYAQKTGLQKKEGRGHDRSTFLKRGLALSSSVVLGTPEDAKHSAECTVTDMSEIVPPEVRPKPAVPAKPTGISSVHGSQGSGVGGQGAGGGSSLLGYIGIDTIIEQMRKKTMKTGFDFNIMVVGTSGLGKSTLVNTLFKSQVSRRSTGWSRDEKIPRTVEIKAVSHGTLPSGIQQS